MASYTDELRLLLTLDDQASRGLRGFVQSLDSVRNRIISTSNSIRQSFSSGFSEIIDGRLVSGLKNPMGKVVNESQYLTETLKAQTSMAQGTKKFMEDLGVSYISGYSGAKNLGGAQKILNSVISDMTKQAKAGSRALADMDETMNKLGKNSRTNTMRFMGLGFAFMFIGMAIKKSVSNALNAITETYKLATGEQSEFNQQMNKLGAAFEFFKFSLMDALASTGVFDFLINAVINIINLFAEMPASLRIFVLVALAALFVAASISAIVGQFLLLYAAGQVSFFLFFQMFGFMWVSLILIIAAVYFLVQVWTDGSKDIVDKIFYTVLIVGLLIISLILVGIVFGIIKGTAISSSLSIVMALLTIIAVAALIYLAWLAVKAIWNNSSLDMVAKILLIVGVLGVLVFAILAVMGIVVAWPLLVAGVVIFIIGLIWAFKDSLAKIFTGIGQWLWGWLTVLVLYWVKAFIEIRFAIIEAILSALVWVAKKFDDFINGLVKKANSVLPKAFRIKWKSDLSGTFAGVKAKVAATRKSLTDPIDAAINKQKELIDKGKENIMSGWDMMKNRAKEIQEGFNKKTKNGANENEGVFGPQTYFGQDPNTYMSSMGVPSISDQSNILDLKGFQEKANSLTSDMLVEQKGIKEEIMKLNETISGGISVIEMPKIGTFEYGGINLEEEMNNISKDYGGSTGN